MSTPMTDERLAEIEARASAATRGPWRTEFVESSVGLGERGFLTTVRRGTETDSMIRTSAQTVRYGDAEVVERHADGTVTEKIRRYDPVPQPKPCPDAEFIANARDDIPELLAEIRRLREEAAP